MVAALDLLLVHESLVLEIARKAGHLPLATFDRALSKLTGAQKL